MSSRGGRSGVAGDNAVDGDDGDENRYVVVTTTYPTTYGCNRGMSWSAADLIARSDKSASAESYGTRDAAVRAAREARNRSEWFTDACAPDPDEEDSDADSDEDAEDDEDEYMFTNSDEPPYDSAALENWDNDEEILIEVMTRAEFDSKEAEDEAFLSRARMEHHFQAKVQRKVFAVQVKDSGRVHYSTPPQPYDIPAEFEVEEKEDVTVESPSNASSIKSLMYRGRNEGLVEYMNKCCGLDVDNEEEMKKLATDKGLLLLLKECTSLEELHLKASGAFPTISVAFVQKMLSVAPHLRDTLKGFSFGMIQVEPGALPHLGGLKMLERLDMMMSFSAEHDDFDFDDYYGQNRPLPYDGPLMECVEKLKHLNRLDLGNGDGESQRYLFDYMLSRDGLSRVRRFLKRQDAEVTMHTENTPAAWSSEARKRAARLHVLAEIVDDDAEGPDLRALAKDELKVCPACGGRASKKCGGCKRQWYCSPDCQRNDFKSHKKLCKESFTS